MLKIDFRTGFENNCFVSVQYFLVVVVVVVVDVWVQYKTRHTLPYSAV